MSLFGSSEFSVKAFNQLGQGAAEEAAVHIADPGSQKPGNPWPNFWHWTRHKLMPKVGRNTFTGPHCSSVWGF